MVAQDGPAANQTEAAASLPGRRFNWSLIFAKNTTIFEVRRAEMAEKHQIILDQAIRTFAELGFRGTDVQVIADRAGVGKGTVYRYFGNKEELFWATTNEVTLRLEKKLLAAMDEVEGSVREKMMASCLAYARFFEENPHCLEITIQERAEFRGTVPQAHRQYHEELIGRFAKIFETGVAVGEFAPRDARETILVMGNLLYGCIIFSCYAADDRSISEVVETAATIFFNGLRANAAGDTNKQ